MPAIRMICSCLFMLGAVAARGEDPNRLTDRETAAGFELLFNGHDFAGWEQNGNWSIEDGTIARREKGGGLAYRKKLIPDDFELRFEWKVGPGSNSGVYYRPGQYEYQILDNNLHHDGKNPRTSAASLYFCMAPSRDATRPVGQWNTGRVVCKGTIIQHWVNGEKVISFDYADPKWAENVDLLRKRGGSLAARGAHLSLQDHGNPVWYRGIKLRTLAPGDKIDDGDVTPAEIPEDVLRAEQEKLKSILERRKNKKQRGKKNAKDTKNVQKRPNFIVVMADDASWNTFDCLAGGYAPRTPNISKLATEGLVFDRCFTATSVCAPVRHEFVSGHLPTKSLYLVNTGLSRKATPYTSIGTRMKDLGYAVGYTGKTSKSFLRYDQYTRFEGSTSRCCAKNTTWSMDGTRDFIRKAQADDKPFFIYWGSIHPHVPWTDGDAARYPEDEIKLPPHVVDTPLTRRCFSGDAAEVEEFDRQVGGIMALLEEMLLEEDTVLIVLSEQGMNMAGGKWSIYDFGTRALCVARWPGKIAAGTRTDAIAMYCDISVTIVKMAGGEFAEEVDGRDIQKLLLEGDESVARPHALMFTPMRRAIRSRDYKLIWTPNPEEDYYCEPVMGNNRHYEFSMAWNEWIEKANTDPVAKSKVDRIVKKPEFELYDMAKDPFEMHNIADDPAHAERVNEMFAELKKSLAGTKDKFAD